MVYKTVESPGGYIRAENKEDEEAGHIQMKMDMGKSVRDFRILIRAVCAFTPYPPHLPLQIHSLYSMTPRMRSEESESEGRE